MAKSKCLLRLVSYDTEKKVLNVLIEGLGSYTEAALFKEHFCQKGYIEKNLSIEPYYEEH